MSTYTFNETISTNLTPFLESSNIAADNIIAGFVFSLENFLAICLYGLVVYVMIKRKFYEHQPPYLIILSMAVAEMLMLLFFFFMGVIIATQNDFVPQSAKFVQTFFFNIPGAVIMAHINILAVQRFAIIFGVSKYPSLQMVFKAKFCKFAVLCAWLLGTGYYMLTYILFPRMVIGVINYELWILQRLYLESTINQTYWLTYNFMCMILSVALSVPVMIKVYFRMKKIGSTPESTVESRSVEKEKVLVYITTIHNLTILFNSAILNVIPRIADSKWIRLFSNCVSVTSYSVAPVIYLCVNKRLREAIKETIWKQPLPFNTQHVVG